MRFSNKPRSETANHNLERINRAVDPIVTHLTEPLRLRDIARAAKLSEFHFHRIFQAIRGETAAGFTKRLRLEKALSLMAFSPSQSLLDVALASGFSSASDFSRCFKKRYGVSPRSFDLKAWRANQSRALEKTVGLDPAAVVPGKLPPRRNPDGFRVDIRQPPSRRVAYIQVDRPYRGDAVWRASQRLIAWAERNGVADRQWLGYQWDNPEITALDDCRYYVAVEVDQQRARGEVSMTTFPGMTIAEVELQGSLDLELRALQWLYGSWLPRSRYVPDDQPAFEVWRGRPFATGLEHFELAIQLPIKFRPKTQGRTRTAINYQSKRGSKS